MLALTNSTLGIAVKFVPVIFIDVAVAGRIVCETFATVGLVSATFTEPPKDTAEPLIVILEFAKCTLSTEPSVMCSEFIASSANLAPVIASAAIFQVVTFTSVIEFVLILLNAIGISYYYLYYLFI